MSDVDKTSDFINTVNYLLDNVLGLDGENQLVEVTATRASGKDGDLTIKLKFALGPTSTAIADSLSFIVDTEKLKQDRTYIFELEEKIRDKLNDYVKEFIAERTEGIDGPERGIALVAGPALESLLVVEVVKPVSTLLAESLLDIELPDRAEIGTILGDAFDKLRGEYFEKFVPDVAKTYAKLGLAEILTTLTSDSSPEWAQAIRSVGEGVLHPVIDNIVTNYFAELPDDRVEIFQNVEFSTIFGNAIANLLVDFEVFDKEILDDILGLDGENLIETWAEELISGRLRDFVQDRFVDALNFLAGDFDALAIERLFAEFAGQFNVQQILGSFFSSFTGEQLADLFIEIDSLPEALLSRLGSTIGSGALGEALGSLAMDAVTTLFGKATASAIGTAIFDGLGAILGAGVGAIAGSVVFELIDDLFDGAISDLFDRIIDWIRNDSPQAFYQTLFDPQTNEFHWSGYAYSKDANNDLRLAVKSTMEAFEERINAVIDFVGEPASIDPLYTNIFFVWGKKHYDESFAAFIGGTESMRVSINRSAEHVAKETIGLVLSHMNFHQGHPITALAYDMWKADVAASSNSALAYFATDALVNLQNLIGLARFANDYRQDPTQFDAMMASDAPVAVTILQQYFEADSKGFNAPTTLKGSILGFEEIGSAAAGDTIILDGPAWRAVARGGDDTIVARAARVQVIDGGTGSDTVAYGAAVLPVIVDLSRIGPQNTGGGGLNTLISIENVIGSASHDRLTGNAEPNRLDGGAGVDSMAGGLGSDTYVVDNAGDRVMEAAGAGIDTVQSSISFALGANLENLALTGIGTLSATGNALANILTGNANSNRLDGGGGADAMAGGLGHDVYVVDHVLDKVTESAGAGNDTVQSSISFTLGSNVENVTLTAIGTTSATGNALANILTGNANSNRLDGRGGADTMLGGLGNDVYVVDNPGDLTVEAVDAGIDTVLSLVSFRLDANVEDIILTGVSVTNATGNALANSLTGNANSNRLDGGGGADRMAGGLGHDVYVVDNVNDTISEVGGPGTDTVRSAVSFTLGAHVENIVLTGIDTIGATGNTLANSLTGNANSNRLDGGVGGDTMAGGLGHDTYVVDNALDRVVEAARGGTDTVESSIGFTLGANVENLLLTGVAVNGTGNALANLLVGNAAANVLNGGVGADTMAGGEGDDLYAVDHTGDRVIEAPGGGTDSVSSSASFSLDADVENLALTGLGTISATGNMLANRLTGNAAANLLDGGAGADALAGGLGDDRYVVDDAGDHVSEAAGAGIDTVQSSVTHRLAANVENLTLTGIAAVDGTGNPLANVLIGNGLANELRGLAGDDRLDGGAAADILIGGTGNDHYVLGSGDTIVELAGEGSDTVLAAASATLSANIENLILTGAAAANGTGNGLANSLTGNVGANRLDGGAGADTMTGGAGADVYLVDNILDKVWESAAGGIDTVLSGLSFTLGANVENLTLTGTGVINATGNVLANTLTGNSNSNRLDGRGGADAMAGGLGHDVYVVDNAGDKVTEAANAGSDTVLSSVTFTLGANVENLTLTGIGTINGTGNALANSLTGNSNSNRLDGGAGADSMAGGLGHDTYVVDNIGDKAVEAANAGSDTVQSSVSFTLGANVENLVLTGSAAVNGTGNGLANAITGNDAANLLRGGAGHDLLRGAAGADSFQFDTAPGSANIDHIADFAHGTDRILLENAVFAGLGAGALPASAFATGTAATSASHRILYDAATGALRFDADGAGGAAAVLFAILDTRPATLAASDFLVI